MSMLAQKMPGLAVGEDFMAYLRSLKHRPILLNSFFGFEKPCALPPNATITGPVVRPENVRPESLGQKNAQMG